ncbi:MAG: carbohydrate ABC transporter permease [Bacilli bacterium]|nr:carbohydrate ABC transporter permease [Bacilli bacterium]
MEDLSRAYQGIHYIKKKRDIAYHVTKWVVFAIFFIYAASLLFPFIWMLISSFKKGEEFDLNIFGFPKEFYGMNFIEILKFTIDGQSIANMILMSVLLTVLGTIINLFFSSCAAYVLAKFKFKGRGIIYGVAIFTMIVPIVGTLPAQVQMMQKLHLDGDNAFMGILFLYSGAFGFNFILLYSSFSSVSNSYLEAASIDGCGRFKTFVRVVLPQCRGSLIACSVLQSIAYWNDYATPRLYLPRGHVTLAVGLQSLQTANSGNYPQIFASMMIAVFPILVLYLIFQKKIIESTNAGGLKG